MQREFGRDLLTDARTNWLEIVGRLRTGQSREQAAEALNRSFSATCVRAAASDASARLPGAGRQGQLARAWRAAIRTHGALCADRARPGARLRQRRLPGRGAVGGPRDRRWRSAWPSAPAVHAWSGNCSPKGLVLAAMGGIAAALIAPWTARALVAAQSTALRIEPGLDPRVLVVRPVRVAADRRHRGAPADPRVEEGQARAHDRRAPGPAPVRRLTASPRTT